MYLKSLTLKGFKSFASATTLIFEPGISAIVGPNGSGKSNIVDALAWVMGEQGAKTLRGGKMQDVIFAGTSGREPLGRAEVTVTIDNSDGALPIEYAEVSVTRRMFRDGASEYEINGSRCRLMDVQELLSDSGIGREMHVIVGQGRLAEILESRPEERRAFIEEAAGVLKHRRRRDKAVRKLSAMRANLDRLRDLTHELKKQLKPLSRQAELAQRAQSIQGNLRDARLRLAADDITTRQRVEQEKTHKERLVRDRYETLKEELETYKKTLEEAESNLNRFSADADRAQNTWFELSTLGEQISATIRIARDRKRALDSAGHEEIVANPDDLLLRAATAETEALKRTQEVIAAREIVESAKAELLLCDQALHSIERARRAAIQESADRREGVARLRGAIDTAQSQVNTIEAEDKRLNDQLNDTHARQKTLVSEYAEVEIRLGESDTNSAELKEQSAQAKRDVDRAVSRRDELRREEQRLGRQIASLESRIATLSVPIDGPNVNEWLREQESTLNSEVHSSAGSNASGRGFLGASVGGVAGGADSTGGNAVSKLSSTLQAPSMFAGILSDKLTITHGWEVAVGVALESQAQALITTSTEGAIAAVDSLWVDDIGQASLLVEDSGPREAVQESEQEAGSAGGKAGRKPGGEAGSVTGQAGSVTGQATQEADGEASTPGLEHDTGNRNHRETQLPQGAVWALDCVVIPRGLSKALSSLLAAVVLVDDIRSAVAVVEKDQRLRAITKTGDTVGLGWLTGGPRRKKSALEVRALIHETEKELSRTSAELKLIATKLAQAEKECERSQSLRNKVRAQIAACDAGIKALNGEKTRLEKTRRIAQGEITKLSARKASIANDHRNLTVQLVDLSERMSVINQEPQEVFRTENDDQQLNSAREAVARARSSEMESRLALRTIEERRDTFQETAHRLRKEAERARVAIERAERRKKRRAYSADIAATIVDVGEQLLQRVREHTNHYAAQKDTCVEKKRVEAQRVASIRDQLNKVSSTLAQSGDALRQEELARTQAVERKSALEGQIIDRFGMGIEELLAEYGPEVPMPPTELELHEYEVAKARGETVTAPQALLFDRNQQEQRAAQAERDLAALGKVNPLALEQFTALEERYKFLTTQLDDVNKTREDLLGVVDDVDERILRVFTEAYHDVAEEFVKVFATLFPGGEGRLLLTDPDDMLTTGIDIEARPPGKRVRRLSLLSGGEKSLTAVALLVAIFRARPSPFYVMDEVEAALDDTNLDRLLVLFDQLRESSQLIVITHQKTTMDIADILYGISMRGNGISTVISQRMHDGVEAETAQG